MPTVYEIVTEKIMKELEKGNIPWEKPWTTETPRNLSSGKAYRGVNIWLLSLAGYSSPWWLTFNQCRERGGHVRKGEHGSVVVFWKFDGRSKYTTKDEDTGESTERDAAPVLRYYTVFNTEQCEGLDVPAISATVPQIDVAEEIAGEYLARGPEFQTGSEASYSILSDTVTMPARNKFMSAEKYYSTLFHELVHSTRHTSRLNRGSGKPNQFGSEEYSKEELAAEMGAAMLCAKCSIDSTVEHSAGYIQGWLKVLKSDKRFVVVAAGQAQKAVDYIAPEEEFDATHENVPFCGEPLPLAA